MIENSFVYAVNKYQEKQRKKQKAYDTKMDKLYEILKKKNLTLVDAKQSDFSKTQLKLIEDLGYMHYLEM